jgi:hypothetical protein
MTPARELDRRGPSLLAAQGARNVASEETIHRIGERNADMAEQEYGLALDQERQARVREAAAQASMAERNEELAQRQADFDSSVKQLGKMGTIDRDRFWASRSTGQKVAGFVELMLSGFRGAPSMLLKRIDDDVKAQEFSYHAARDATQAKQTAFSMAMTKYNNADAARAMARAAAIDVTQAQLAQVSAKWKGTEAANKADIGLAALQDEKMMQIANGIQFIPPQYMGRRFVDPETGFTYNEAEAKAFDAKRRERNFERQKLAATVGGQLEVAQVNNQTELTKAAISQQSKADEGASHISQQLLTAGVPQARAAAEKALASMNVSPPSFTETVARTVQPDAVAARTMSDASNEREQAWNTYKNQAMKALFGNVTKDEERRAEKAFGSADTPEQRRAAINMTLDMLGEIERNAKAGQSPAAQAKFDSSREAATTNRAAAPPSAKKGW